VRCTYISTNSSGATGKEGVVCATEGDGLVLDSDADQRGGGTLQEGLRGSYGVDRSWSGEGVRRVCEEGIGGHEGIQNVKGGETESEFFPNTVESAEEVSNALMLHHKLQELGTSEKDPPLPLLNGTPLPLSRARLVSCVHCNSESEGGFYSAVVLSGPCAEV